VTALCAVTVSSAMFNDRGKNQMGGAEASRGQRVASLYAEHAHRVKRLVARHAAGDVDDACQIAWERLIGHDEVDLDGRGVVNWLVITATREGWKWSGCELPLSTDGELAEPAGHAPDPLNVVVDRDEVRRRLARLTDREREFLALQALGLSYSEIAQATGSSLRTVERQILRARHKLGSLEAD
jgi:DNA-directed RNA polymerase specialized sigma24 family protein